MPQFKKCLVFLIFIIHYSGVVAQTKNAIYEQALNTLNSPKSTDRDKARAFGVMISTDSLSTSAEAYVEQKLSRSDTVSDLLKNKLYFAYECALSNNQKALLHAERILSDSKCSTEDSIAVFGSLSHYYKDRGYYNLASNYAIKVINIHSENKNYLGTEQGYKSLAMIMMSQKMYNLAIFYYKKAINNKTISERPKHAWSTLNNIGLAHKYSGRLDSALHYFNQCLDKMKMYEPKKGKDSDEFILFDALIKGNIGDVYILQAKYAEALPLLHYDLAVSLDQNTERNACISRIQLAKALIELGSYKEGKEQLDEAFITIQKNKYRQLKVKHLLFSAEYYNKIENHKKSNQFYADYVILSDSINKESINNSIVKKGIENIYMLKDEALENAIDKNEADSKLLAAQKRQLYFTVILIGVLVLALFLIYRSYRQKSALNKEMNTKNKEIKQKGVELAKTLDEKELMLKEVHHRVKNNLQLVSSLLRLQSNEMDDPKVHTAIEESINRLNSISLVHKKLYMKDNFQTIQFKAYYESLIAQVSDLYTNTNKNITYQTDVKDIDLTIDNAIPLGLIINEIISNSYKHAFLGRDEGVVSISLDKQNDKVHLVLRDNGVGFKKKAEESKSFGETLIYLLAEQIDGQINCYFDAGTVYEISFNDKD